jgi:2',3'-cyclic-nucleotide 2'-phosphodiesterase (5'-nucleotidase family)
MGNLIADALRAALRADVAIINGGGIRGDYLYEPGVTLTRQDILRELPFGNVGVLLEMSGADLRAALEHGVSQVEAKAGRFPQVSGVRLVFDPSKDAGSRVLEVTINGTPIDLTASYRVATVDYLFKGGDGYSSFSQAKVLIDANSGPLLATVVMHYISAKGTVAPTVEGRIVTRGE